MIGENPQGSDSLCVSFQIKLELIIFIIIAEAVDLKLKYNPIPLSKLVSFHFLELIHDNKFSRKKTALFQLPTPFKFNLKNRIQRYHNAMKFGVVNKSTTVNRFFLHSLQRNITHLDVITRKTYIKLGILKKGTGKEPKKRLKMPVRSLI